MKLKQGKSKSFVKEILWYLLVLAGLLFILLGAFFCSSYDILEREIKDSSEAFLQIYSSEFDNSINKMDDILKSITMQGQELAGIKSADGNERALASISLHKHMQDLIAATEFVDAIVVYDSGYEVCLDSIGKHVGYEQKNAIRDCAIEALEDESVESAVWKFVQIGNELYLYKPIKFSGRIIVIYTQMENLLPTLDGEISDNRAIMLTDRDGNIGMVWGGEETQLGNASKISAINEKNFYKKRTSVAEDTLYIYCITGKGAIFEQAHTGMIIVAIVVCTAVLFLLYIVQYTRKHILFPMKQMVEDMEHIKGGAYETRIRETFDTQEFQMLQETTNQMVEEIVGLKIQAYEEQIELQGMELKSIRLQLKPHFFLNALTTISSLSSQNKNEKIQAYINALSKNVRYMFRTGFHTVTVREEIRHVENYFEMQELKYPDCVFYLVDLPEALMEWQIPQMLIHTFIENEYKYAISMGEILTVLIKISTQKYQGEEMLLIEIEDDGKGYPKEVLEYMNSGVEYSGKKGERIGLWSIKRMMELMYDRKELIQLSNIEPHGCMNRIYVPLEPIHALEEETIQKTL